MNERVASGPFFANFSYLYTKLTTMLGFTPFKRHANRFNYTPRYFDPAKEAREERRAELCGTRSGDDGQEYRPGQYLRTQREARASRRAAEQERGNLRILKMGAAAVLVLLFIYLLYPRLAELFVQAQRTPEKREQAGEFDPSRPITIVPNDYQE